MATKGLTKEQVQEAVNAVNEHGTVTAAALALGMSRGTLSSRYHAKDRPEFKDGLDPVIKSACEAGGIEDVRNLSHFWQITKDEEGNGYSLFIKNPHSGEQFSLQDMVQNALADAPPLPKFEKRKSASAGDRLLVIDIADIHFLKLCVKTETGFEYNSEVARHRMIEGTKALLNLSKSMGIGKILYVTGNDLLHVDNAQKTTTSGTSQDVSGTVFDGFRDAKNAVLESIQECAKIADVDLIHNMSNHDWFSGWALAQCLADRLSKHPNVNATPYNMSERHRKYYAFEKNLIGLSHGDGAKEEKLYGLMVKEARDYISECPNLYWLLHHIHHKVRKLRGSENPITREKDHNGMTAIMSGSGMIEGEELQIEYVRSPSPPDGWHDRNGYINRQAVECFVFDPHEGMKARFTEWF